MHEKFTQYENINLSENLQSCLFKMTLAINLIIHYYYNKDSNNELYFYEKLYRELLPKFKSLKNHITSTQIINWYILLGDTMDTVKYFSFAINLYKKAIKIASQTSNKSLQNIILKLLHTYIKYANYHIDVDLAPDIVESTVIDAINIFVKFIHAYPSISILKNQCHLFFSLFLILLRIMEKTPLDEHKAKFQQLILKTANTWTTFCETQPAYSTLSHSILFNSLKNFATNFKPESFSFDPNPKQWFFIMDRLKTISISPQNTYAFWHSNTKNSAYSLKSKSKTYSSTSLLQFCLSFINQNKKLSKQARDTKLPLELKYQIAPYFIDAYILVEKRYIILAKAKELSIQNIWIALPLTSEPMTYFLIETESNNSSNQTVFEEFKNFIKEQTYYDKAISLLNYTTFNELIASRVALTNFNNTLYSAINLKDLLPKPSLEEQLEQQLIKAQIYSDQKFKYTL